MQNWHFSDITFQAKFKCWTFKITRLSTAPKCEYCACRKFLNCCQIIVTWFPLQNWNIWVFPRAFTRGFEKHPVILAQFFSPIIDSPQSTVALTCPVTRVQVSTPPIVISTNYSAKFANFNRHSRPLHAKRKEARETMVHRLVVPEYSQYMRTFWLRKRLPRLFFVGRYFGNLIYFPVSNFVNWLCFKIPKLLDSMVI